MDVENRHENADLDCGASKRVVAVIDSFHFKDFAVGGAQDVPVPRGRASFGIPEKEKHKNRENANRVCYGLKR